MDITRKIKIRRLKKEIGKCQRLYKELYFLHARKEDAFNAATDSLNAFRRITGHDYDELTRCLYDRLLALEAHGQASAAKRRRREE